MPVARMADCHERIRRFVGGLDRLAGLDDPADPRAPEAARQIARYFREGLRLHAQDEDLSVAPRLRGADPALDALLDRLEADHAAVDAALPAVLADLDAVAGGAPVERPRFAAHHARVAGILLPHLEEEEGAFFAAVHALPEAERRRIVEEMVARRR